MSEGEDSPALKEGRAFGVQALSGTGALRKMSWSHFRLHGGEGTGTQAWKVKEFFGKGS